MLYRRKRNPFFIIAFIVCAFAGWYVGQRRSDVGVGNERHAPALSAQRKQAWRALEKRIAEEISRFEGDAGIVIKDLETGWEFAHQPGRLFASASLAKIPLMAACFYGAEQGRIRLDRNIALKGADKLTGSGVLKDMPVGTTLSVERLIGLMMYDSDNTATHMITNALGLDYVNSTFRSFGLKNTELSRKIADYRARDQGLENYTTAEDMAMLLENIYRRSLGGKNVSNQSIATLKLVRMNDRIPKYLPPEITVAHKTGIERGVCHDAGIVFTCRGDFIIVVLTGHSHPNSNPSKEFIAQVALHTYNYFEQL